MKGSYACNGKFQREPFCYLFTRASEVHYFVADRYLTKAELRDIEETHNLSFKGYSIPTERFCEFALCEQLEKAIENFFRS
jgi:hypothetical protein